MEFFHNGANTAAAGANAGTHRIDALCSGADSNLTSGTGLTGNVADFYLTVSNFRSFQFKQAAYHIGMGTGYVDQRTTGCAMYFQNINTDMVAGSIAFAGDLLCHTQNSIALLRALTDADKYITGGIYLQNGSIQQLRGLGGIVFVNNSALSLTDTLNHNLLGSLCGNTAEFLEIDGQLNHITQLSIGIKLPCSVNVDLGGGILHFLHNSLGMEHEQTLFTQVYHNVLCRDVLVILLILAISIGQRLLQALHHVIYGDALELF